MRAAADGRSEQGRERPSAVAAERGSARPPAAPRCPQPPPCNAGCRQVLAHLSRVIRRVRLARLLPRSLKPMCPVRPSPRICGAAQQERAAGAASAPGAERRLASSRKAQHPPWLLAPARAPAGRCLPPPRSPARTRRSACSRGPDAACVTSRGISYGAGGHPPCPSGPRRRAAQHARARRCARQRTAAPPLAAPCRRARGWRPAAGPPDQTGAAA